MAQRGGPSPSAPRPSRSAGISHKSPCLSAYLLPQSSNVQKLKGELPSRFPKQQEETVPNRRVTGLDPVLPTSERGPTAEPRAGRASGLKPVSWAPGDKKGGPSQACFLPLLRRARDVQEAPVRRPVTPEGDP